MPRRPSKSKGASKSKARPISRAEGKIKRWDKLSDIPMDEEDQCMFICTYVMLRTEIVIPQFTHREIRFFLKEKSLVTKAMATRMKSLD
jgi:hypothetical protein